jgi:hypothetical protein
MDYQKVGDKVKSGGHSFFDALGGLIMFFFKVIGKFIGILLIIIGAAVLIALFVGLFTVGILDIIHIPGIDFYDIVNSTEAPVWLVTLLTFFAVGIPFFFLLYLGLKILVNNLKSIGNIAKFSLLGLWLLSIITLAVLGIQQASAHAYTGSQTLNETLYFQESPDTLRIRMQSSELYENQDNVGIRGMTVTYNEAGERLLFSDEIYFDVKKSQDSLTHIRIRKDADGNSLADARQRAGKINYGFEQDGRTIILNDYLTTAIRNKVRDQGVRLTLYVPEGTVLQFDASAKGHIGRGTRFDEDLYRFDVPDYIWIMQDDRMRCLDCPEELKPVKRDQNGHIIIDEDGVDIDLGDEKDSFKMKIDENGIRIKTGEDQ